MWGYLTLGQILGWDWVPLVPGPASEVGTSGRLGWVLSVGCSRLLQKVAVVLSFQGAAGVDGFKWMTQTLSH